MYRQWLQSILAVPGLIGFHSFRLISNLEHCLPVKVRALTHTPEHRVFLIIQIERGVEFGNVTLIEN